ncbi:MAG: pyridoxamine 5'-phosphate oxidase family protein [Propionibacteriales bacterium]|nr:pyridoxamine 5'-phosphate oxidase family protein [Propionibacteriales bacterium]
MQITTLEQLRAAYPSEPSPNAVAKESAVVTPLYEKLIKTSPFCVVTTVGDGGLDCSPRGDGAGFVTVRDSGTLEVPDRRGNNRLDTLHNLIKDPRIGLIFLIPGVSECVRVRGTAAIRTDEDLLASHAVKGKRPSSVIVVSVARIYFQCARAVIRSSLWNPDHHVDRGTLPTAGQLTEEAGGFSRAERIAYDEELAGRQARTLY